MGAGADEGAERESLVAALDEVIAETSALVRVLSERGEPQERRIAAQLAAALAALAATRGGLAAGGDEAPPRAMRQPPRGNR